MCVQGSWGRPRGSRARGPPRRDQVEGSRQARLRGRRAGGRSSGRGRGQILVASSRTGRCPGPQPGPGGPSGHRCPSAPQTCSLVLCLLEVGGRGGGRGEAACTPSSVSAKATRRLSAWGPCAHVCSRTGQDTRRTGRGLSPWAAAARGEGYVMGGTCGEARPLGGCPDVSVQLPLWERGWGLASAKASRVPGTQGCAPGAAGVGEAQGASLGCVLPSSDPAASTAPCASRHCDR